MRFCSDCPFLFFIQVTYQFKTATGEQITWMVKGNIVKLCDFGVSRIRLDNGEVLFNPKAPLRDYFDPTVDIVQVKKHTAQTQMNIRK